MPVATRRRLHRTWLETMIVYVYFEYAPGPKPWAAGDAKMNEPQYESMFGRIGQVQGQNPGSAMGAKTGPQDTERNVPVVIFLMTSAERCKCIYALSHLNSLW